MTCTKLLFCCLLPGTLSFLPIVVTPRQVVGSLPIPLSTWTSALDGSSHPWPHEGTHKCCQYERVGILNTCHQLASSWKWCFYSYISICPAMMCASHTDRCVLRQKLVPQSLQTGDASGWSSTNSPYLGVEWSWMTRLPQRRYVKISKRTIPAVGVVQEHVDPSCRGGSRTCTRMAIYKFWYERTIDGWQALRDYTVELYRSFVCLQHSFRFMTTNHICFVACTLYPGCEVASDVPHVTHIT
jgi:hypothetical protein